MTTASPVASFVTQKRLQTPGFEVSKGDEAICIPRLVEGFGHPGCPEPTDAYTRWFRSVPSDESITHDRQFQAALLLRKEVDALFGNLETPLSFKRRRQGMFNAPPAMAAALKTAGFDVLGLANNHAFDAGYEGLLETIRHLSGSHIQTCGYASNVLGADAILNTRINDCKIAWIGVTQKCNSGLAGTSATVNRDGILPMDPDYVCDLIKRARSIAQLVVVVPHWSWDESISTPESCLVECAHLFIDSGADIVVGSGPHVMQGCEVYKGRLIVYCLGNFIFGHDADNWGDNLMLRIQYEPGCWRASFIPISGRGADLYCPHVLDGARSDAALRHFAAMSNTLGTALRIHQGRALIDFHIIN